MAHGLDERPSRPIADASQAVAPATHRSSRGGDLEEVGLCARMATKDTETTGLIASVTDSWSLSLAFVRFSPRMCMYGTYSRDRG